MEPFRIDMREESASIISDIEEAVAHSKMILADVSANAAGLVNENAMYELGLAHAVRLPAEVLVICDNAERLPFNIAHIRAHEIGMAHPNGAAQRITALLRSGMEEMRTQDDWLVDRLYGRCEYGALTVLASCLATGFCVRPRGAGLAQLEHKSLIEPAIRMLVGEGALELDLSNDWTRNPRYRLTPLGNALCARLSTQLAAFPPVRS